MSLDELRTRVRALIEAEAPRLPRRAGFRSPSSPEEDQALRAWRTRLYAEGYVGGDWPTEWGGRGEQVHPLEDLVVSEELERAGLPPLTDQTHLAAFVLLRFGSEEQKRRHLWAIREGREVWCQLFSEPEAGSDLAAMRTRAEHVDGGFLVNGQKVWSSNAQWSEYGFLLARTGSQESRHRGISAFIVDMRSPGVDIRPLREITGSEDFSEVFLDAVELPADALLGRLDQGWQVAMEGLGAERSGIGAGAARLRHVLADLADLARRTTVAGRPASEDAAVRQQLGRFAAMVEVCNQLVYTRLEHELQGRPAPADVPVGKLAFSELNLAMVEYGMRLEGEAALAPTGDAPPDTRSWQDEFLYARTYTVAGGSSEIMRNMLAERVLGMPREERQTSSEAKRSR
jgi:alkylation response protein AidB-like acyl-CoA dehydrogenase